VRIEDEHAAVSRLDAARGAQPPRNGPCPVAGQIGRLRRIVPADGNGDRPGVARAGSAQAGEANLTVGGYMDLVL
jgi:hypothetical protein